MFNTLVREYNRCPPNCSACEEACLKAKGDVLPLIKSVHIPVANFNGVMTCHQCYKPSCLEVCPTGAITRSGSDGVIRINDNKCVGCGLCTLACPYGCIYYRSDKGQAIKCDLCSGKPKCVEACKHNALTFFNGQTLSSHLDKGNLLAPGVTLCAGCTLELALRTTYKVLGNKDVIYFSAPGCNAPAVNGAGWSGGGPMSTVAANSYACMMTNIASSMTGVSRYFHKIGKDVKCVCFVGDGATADIGFQSLSAAAERGENLIYICYDNEGYMNTGIQRSSTTPYKSWTSTTWVGPKSKGKGQKAKNMPLIMLMHDIPYVATATVAYLEDYVQKLEKAKALKNGLAYIHLLAPCPTGWRAPIDSGIELSRLAVQSNYFPLWEAEDGKMHFTYEVENPKPIQEFTKLMGRFSHLKGEDLQEFQRMVDERFAQVKGLVGRTA